MPSVSLSGKCHDCLGACKIRSRNDPNDYQTVRIELSQEDCSNVYTYLNVSRGISPTYNKSLDTFIVLLSSFSRYAGGIGGLGYGLFQKQQRTVSDKNLQTSLEKIEGLSREKLKIESEFATIHEEMKGIRQMAKQIQQTLGILGQGGGDTNIVWNLGETEGQTDDQQENSATISDSKVHAHEAQQPLTPSN